MARPSYIKETFSFEGDSRANLDAALKEGHGVMVFPLISVIFL